MSDPSTRAQDAKIVDHPAARRDEKVFNYELSFVLGKNSVQGRILTDFPQSMSEADLAEWLPAFSMVPA